MLIMNYCCGNSKCVTQKYFQSVYSYTVSFYVCIFTQTQKFIEDSTSLYVLGVTSNCLFEALMFVFCTPPTRMIINQGNLSTFHMRSNYSKQSSIKRLEGLFICKSNVSLTILTRFYPFNDEILNVYISLPRLR